MRRPTRRAAVLTGVAILLVLAGSTAQAGWLFVLSAGVAGLVVVSLFWPHRLKHLSATTEMPSSVAVGEIFPARLKLKNDSARRVSPLRAEGSFPGLEDQHLSLPSPLATGASVEGSVRVSAIKRGVYEQGEVTFRSGAPFGIAISRRTINVANRMVVVPRTVHLRSFPLDLSATSHSGEEEALRAGVGDEFLGVRPYRSGDPRRAVHWRSTARAGQLIVREFQEPSRQAVEVIVAGVAPQDDPGSSFETAISAAASTALYMLALGHPLKLRFVTRDGPQYLEPGSERAVLVALAAATPSDLPLEELWQGVGRSAVAVFVTSAGAPGVSLPGFCAAAARSDRRVTAVVVDSASWGETGAPVHPALPSTAIVRILTKDEEMAQCLAA